VGKIGRDWDIAHFNPARILSAWDHEEHSMNQPVGGTTAKTKSGKSGTDFGSAFDAFALPTGEIPAAFREAAEKSVSQARDVYARIKNAAEETTDLLEETYETMREGSLAAGLKTLEATKANADASFALYRDLIGAKTFADALELQTAFARKQFDAMAGQVRDFQEFAQKFAVDSAKPARVAWEKAFKEAKIS
jgi:phasin